jgi:5-methylcytosine-specific restriction protein A
MSVDGSRIYLTINQGCTTLKNAVGIPGAHDELQRRATSMRTKLDGRTKRLSPVGIELGSGSWRASLYEAGEVLSKRYDTSVLPDEKDLVSDLQDALALYNILKLEVGWIAEDEILKEAEEDGLILALTQAKNYKQHRGIERNSSHSRQVKKLQGYTCKGCARSMVNIYGDPGKDLIHAHHLTPLSQLADGSTVSFDARTDFAVLCPNCHAIIHRLDDVSDLALLRALYRRNAS